MSDKALADMATKRLWLASAFIDDHGEIGFDVSGLDEHLAANCRSLARGKTLGWTPFAVCGSTQEASTACDTLLRAMKEHAARNGARTPRTVEEKFARLTRLAARRWAKNPPVNDVPMDEDEPEPAEPADEP